VQVVMCFFASVKRRFIIYSVTETREISIHHTVTESLLAFIAMYYVLPAYLPRPLDNRNLRLNLLLHFKTQDKFSAAG
jgi:hypothetical protein